MSMHNEVLKRLCRVCGCLNKRGAKTFNVENYVDDLKSSFWLHDIDLDRPDVHPKIFCMRCYKTLKNIKKGHAHSGTIFFSWSSCGVDCSTCNQFILQSKVGRKPGKSQEVKGTMHGQFSINWSRNFTLELKSKLPMSTLDDSLNASNFDIEFNPSLPLCECTICKSILRGPVMIEGCQHPFCLGCLAQKFEGQTGELHCPQCDVIFTRTQVVPCLVRNALVNELKIYCKCGERFNVLSTFEEHKKGCHEKEKTNLTVSDLLNIDLNEPLPETVERATLRILEHKVNLSESGTAQFNSGGPRVSFYNSTET